MALNERSVQNMLWRSMQGAQVVCPNFTPARWFECDMFSVSKAGYWTEHEIKLTASDFRADAAKSLMYRRDRREGDEPGPFKKVIDYEKKHDLLAAGDTRGPSLFWYITTEDVAKAVEVPHWAGLKVVWGDHNLYQKVVRPAPRLHKERASERLIEQARVAMCWRYWRMRVYRRMDEPEEVEQVVDCGDGELAMEDVG